MFVSLWHYLKGYVIVKVSGSNVERLLNLMTRHHLTVWQVKREDADMTFCISTRDFKAMKHDVKKAKCRVRIIEKRGLPFITFRYKRRKLFVMGIGLFVLLVWALTSFVWLIEIEGNERLNPSDIIATLDEQGYTTGKLKSKMDLRKAETLLLKTYPDLVWIGIDYEGTRMVVRIAESVLPPQMAPTDGKPTALVAKRDALITYIAVEKGKPMVKAGDIVKKGDMLVAGEMPLGEENPAPYYAMGKANVRGKTVYATTMEMPLKEVTKHYIGDTSKKYRLKVFDASWQFFSQKEIQGDYDTFITLHQLKITKLFPLPFAIEVETDIGYQATTKELTKEEAKDKLLAAMWKDVSAKLSEEARILERTATFKEDEEKVTGNLYIIAEEEIAYAVELKEEMLNKGEIQNEQS